MSIADRYRIGGQIKKGGMAEVLEAFALGDQGFERRVALKRLLDGANADPSFVRGFIDEARIASSLHHANIAAVLDFGIVDDGPVLVMEHVDGLDLTEWLDRAGREGRTMPAELALSIAADVARALDYAHRATDREGRLMGLVHRDVSPENVLVSFEGDVKLTDFGIAFALRRLEATRVGVAKGKLGYIAPEQLRGQDVDGRADIFSLGCVLHTMVAGKSPIDGSPAELFERAIDPGLPADVAELVERATRIARKERYASAIEMASACALALAKRGVTDPRALLRAWLTRLRPSPAPQPRPKQRAGDLLEIALVAEVAPEEEELSDVVVPLPDAPRRFASLRVEPVRVEPVRVEPVAPVEDTPPAGPVSKTFAAPDPLLGAMVHGFRIAELIAHGPWADTYRALHEAFDREAWLAVLHERPELDGTLARLVFRRVEEIAWRAPPYAILVEDCGFTPGNRPFLLTRPSAGRPLSRVLREEAPLSGARALSIALPIAESLAVAHAAGVVHGSLGPHAIMVSEVGVEILDFGIAPVLRGGGADPSGDLAALGAMIRGMIGSGEDETTRALRALAPALTSGDASAAAAKLAALAPRPGARRSSFAVFALAFVAVAALIVVLALPKRTQPPPPVVTVEEAKPPPPVRAKTSSAAKSPKREPEPAREPAPPVERPRTRPAKKTEPSLESAAVIEERELTDAELAAALARIATALSSAEGKLPARELDAIESRYLALRAALDAPHDAAGRRELAKKIRALESRLTPR